MGNINDKFTFLKSEFDITKLPNTPLQNNMCDDITARINREQQETIRRIEQSRKAKEREELQRHNEMLAALKEAGEKGATIIIGDNAKDLQIQQNATSSSQSMYKQEVFDFEKVLGVLEEIQDFFEVPKFRTTFGEDAKKIEDLVKESISNAQANKNQQQIKKALSFIKEVSVAVGSNIISSGILALIGTIPF